MAKDFSSSKIPKGKKATVVGDRKTIPFLMDKGITTETGQIDLTPVARKILRSDAEGKRACLVVLSGMDVGRIIPLDEGVVVIGRSSECTSVLQEDGISRLHAKIWLNKSGRAVIRDLNSTNGTYVEGRKITEAALEPGTKVLLGRHTVIKFQLQDTLDRVYHQEMYESSTRDALTGAFNRKYLIDRVPRDLSYARRHRIAISFVMFDIDRFKQLNDKYGQLSGDHVLINITTAVAEMMRTEDVLARYGGEEFAIIAQGINLTGGNIFGERIRDRVARRETPAKDGSGEILKVTVSVGIVSVHPFATVDPATLISAADNNLYQAKKNGRNQVVSTLLR